MSHCLSLQMHTFTFCPSPAGDCSFLAISTPAQASRHCRDCRGRTFNVQFGAPVSGGAHKALGDHVQVTSATVGEKPCWGCSGGERNPSGCREGVLEDRSPRPTPRSKEEKGRRGGGRQGASTGRRSPEGPAARASLSPGTWNLTLKERGTTDGSEEGRAQWGLTLALETWLWLNVGSRTAVGRAA